MREPAGVVARYREEDGIYVLRLSGEIDGRELEAGAESLRRTLESNLGEGEAIKLLVDFREARWDSEKTHMAARRLLERHLQGFRERHHFSAVLSNHPDFQAFEHEAFFTEECDALNWLRGARDRR